MRPVAVGTAEEGGTQPSCPTTWPLTCWPHTQLKDWDWPHNPGSLAGSTSCSPLTACLPSDITKPKEKSSWVWPPESLLQSLSQSPWTGPCGHYLPPLTLPTPDHGLVAKHSPTSGPQVLLRRNLQYLLWSPHISWAANGFTSPEHQVS